MLRGEYVGSSELLSAHTRHMWHFYQASRVSLTHADCAEDIAKSACIAFHWSLLYSTADGLAQGKNWWDMGVACVARYARCSSSAWLASA
jgi:hypothetical protein